MLLKFVRVNENSSTYTRAQQLFILISAAKQDQKRNNRNPENCIPVGLNPTDKSLVTVFCGFGVFKKLHILANYK
jgi:hypothetical protein